MAVIGIWIFYENIGRLINAIFKKSYKNFKNALIFDTFFLIKSGGVILLLCFYRMFFVVDFITDFPRETTLLHEGFTGILTGLYAIWGPDQYNHPPALTSGWGWTEAAAYIGIGTFVVLLLVGVIGIYTKFKKKESVFTYSPLLLGSLLLSFFILGMGDFGPFAPYTILSHFPIFNSMRVATRWLMWTSLFVLFIIAAYKGKFSAKIINVILFVTIIELFISGTQVLSHSYFLTMRQYRSSSAAFEQGYRYDIPRVNYANNKFYLTNYWYDENLLETTRNNIGQVIAGDSLVDTRQPNTTIRCGVNQGDCNFISNNGVVAYWSPNKIIIERIANGPIVLNANPGKGWLVNGQYIFKDDKITDPLKTVVLTNPDKQIVLQYAPKLSPLWLKTMLKQHL